MSFLGAAGVSGGTAGLTGGTAGLTGGTSGLSGLSGGTSGMAAIAPSTSTALSGSPTVGGLMTAMGEDAKRNQPPAMSLMQSGFQSTLPGGFSEFQPQRRMSGFGV